MRGIGGKLSMEKILYEKTFPVVTLPSVEFKPKASYKCQGDDAITIVVEAKEKPSNGLIKNGIRGPAEFVLDFNANSWEATQIGEKEVLLTLKRSVIQGQQSYRNPVGRLYYHTRAKFPAWNWFTLLFDQEMSSLGFAEYGDSFDCCDDGDCRLKLGIDSATCQSSNQCVVPTSSPTESPSHPFPTSSPTTHPTSFPTSPTTSPTTLPTSDPTGSPTLSPSTRPPTSAPTSLPAATTPPTASSTFQPSRTFTPTLSPTMCDSTRERTECCSDEECPVGNECRNNECCQPEDACCGSTDPCCGMDDCAGSTGDPHMTTFDGLRYDCHGGGEFVLARSGSMEMHARFERLRGSAAYTTGVVLAESQNETVVEISLSKKREPVIVINGIVSEPLYGSLNRGSVKIENLGNSLEGPYRIKSLRTLLNLYVDVKGSRYINVRVGLPPEYKALGTKGLLGTADGNSLNDWTSPDGNTISISNHRYGAGALAYCNSWCIRNATDSLFTHFEDGRDFSYYSHCKDSDDAFDDPVVDISKASNELKALCGQDVACRIDGIVLGLDAAMDTLSEQAAIDAAQTKSEFFVAPTAIAVNMPFDIVVTVDLSTASNIPQGSIDSYALYHLDPDGSQRASPVLILKDTGSGLGEDAIARDMIFSGVLPINSHQAGQEFGFRAVPVIDGKEDQSSTVVFTKTNAVRSFSATSGIGTTAPTLQPSDEPSVRPSVSPSSSPTAAPTLVPSTSVVPSEEPTLSAQPSDIPSIVPSLTQQPSAAPSGEPTLSQQPSTAPSHLPTSTLQPSDAPSAIPSGLPSSHPKAASKKSSKRSKSRAGKSTVVI